MFFCHRGNKYESLPQNHPLSRQLMSLNRLTEKIMLSASMRECEYVTESYTYLCSPLMEIFDFYKREAFRDEDSPPPINSISGKVKRGSSYIFWPLRYLIVSLVR